MAHAALITADQRHQALRSVAEDRAALQRHADHLTRQRDAERQRADTLYGLATTLYDQCQTLSQRAIDTDKENDAAQAYIDSRELAYTEAGAVIQHQLTTLQRYRVRAEEAEGVAVTASPGVDAAAELCRLADDPVETDRLSAQQRERQFVETLGVDKPLLEQYEDATQAVSQDDDAAEPQANDQMDEDNVDSFDEDDPHSPTPDDVLYSQRDAGPPQQEPVEPLPLGEEQDEEIGEQEFDTN